MTDLIKAAKLWQRTSAKTGKVYYTGRWGGCRVLVFENDKEGEGEPTHWLMLGDAEQGAQPKGERRQTVGPVRRSDTHNVATSRHSEAHNLPALVDSTPAAMASAPAKGPPPRGDGWRGSAYRRRANGRAAAAAGDGGGFHDDPLDDIGRE